MLTNEIVVDLAEVQWCRWMDADELRRHSDLLESNLHFFEALDANVFQLTDETA